MDIVKEGYVDIAKEVFDIAEAAKKNGHKLVANIAFAALLDLHDYHRVDVRFELETDDLDGRVGDAQVHYDLAVLRYEDKYLNIPISLLTVNTACWFMKKAKLKERLHHARPRELSKSGISCVELMEKLLALAIPSVGYSLHRHLGQALTDEEREKFVAQFRGHYRNFRMRETPTYEQ